MKRIITNALLGTGVALTAVVLVACNNDDNTGPEQPLPYEPNVNVEQVQACWAEDDTGWLFDDSLSQADMDTVSTACMFSTLDFEEPVTLAELRILEADYKADEECAFALEVTAECTARLDHDLTIEEVRKGITE